MHIHVYMQIHIHTHVPIYYKYTRTCTKQTPNTQHHTDIYIYIYIYICTSINLYRTITNPKHTTSNKQGHPRTSIIVNTMFQFAYTYLFGTFATFVFLRSGHLPTIIL